MRTRSSASTIRMRALRGVEGAEVAAHVAGDLGDLAGHLDAGRPGADDDEGQQRGLGLGVGLELGRLEGLEDPPADGERALERLELGRVLLPLVVAEVGVLRAARDDQGVVLERRRARCPARRRAARRGARRGRRRPPRRGRRARCAGGGRCSAAGSRSRPARRPPWPPGRRAAGRGGSCAGRPASPRPAGARASGRPAGRRSRLRRRRRGAARTGWAAPWRRSCRMRALGYFSTRAARACGDWARMRPAAPRTSARSPSVPAVTRTAPVAGATP